MLPENFLFRMRNLLGEEYDSFIQSLSQTPPVSIRLNPCKREETFSSEENIPWSKEGRYLNHSA